MPRGWTTDSEYATLKAALGEFRQHKKAHTTPLFFSTFLPKYLEAHPVLPTAPELESVGNDMQKAMKLDEVLARRRRVIEVCTAFETS